MTWYGRQFEPDDIDLSTINQRFAKLARRRTQGKVASENAETKATERRDTHAAVLTDAYVPWRYRSLPARRPEA